MKTKTGIRSLFLALFLALLTMPVAWADPCGGSSCDAAVNVGVDTAASADAAVGRGGDWALRGSLQSTNAGAAGANFVSGGCGPGSGGLGASNCAIIFQEIPEPGTLTLLGIALIAATFLARRRKGT
jgi:hypothetical protein